MNDREKVKAYMEREAESTLRECDGDKSDARDYLIADAGEDCGLTMLYNELHEIAMEVIP